jgi:regulator of sigma E protease
MNIILNFMQGAFFSIVPFVILLGILVFVHEFGHFIVARLNGVRVEVFSLGFGKKIFQYKRGDTNYCISIVPLGGYVKMFGDQPGADVSEADKGHSFTHKNVWRRISIVLAGPLMNFFFAVLVFFIVAIIGEDFRTTNVGDISPETKAYQYGLRSGDKVVAVDDSPVLTWDELDSRLAELHDQQAILQVQRANSPSPLAIKVDVAAKANPNVLSTDPVVGEIEGLTSLSKATRVGVMKNSPLAAAGLKSGDIITGVNGTKVSYWRDLDSVLKKQDAKAPLVLDIERYPTSEADGAESSESAKSETMSLTLAPIGLSQYSLSTLKLENSEVYLGAVIKDSPAEAAGLLPGDRLVKMNSIAINQWDDVVAAVKTYDGKNPVQVHVDRNGESLNMSIVPKLFTQMTPGGLEESRFSIGIKPYVNYANPEVINVSTNDLGKALKLGTKRTWDVSVMTVMSFVRLIQGRVSPKNIGGVISIGKAASETFKIGASQFLRMMGLISVNLFILNLLPIPVLDGGHLLFYLIEGVKGAPVSIKKMEYAQQIGMFLLMGLMVLALFNDFSRLFHL